MKCGFIGAGRLATALAIGICNSNQGATINVFDPDSGAIDRFRSQLDQAASDATVSVLDSNQSVLDSSSTVFIAVKPQNLEAALQHLVSRKETTFVSVVAGVTIDRLSGLLKSSQVVRTMPNTPCLVGAGVIGIAPAEDVDRSVFDSICRLLSSVGTVVPVTESQLDAVTGLSGSGPAYVFSFLEALIDGGLLCGLPREIATTLAMKTVTGSMKLLEETGGHPALLREQVSSPGGTTVFGLEALEQAGFRNSIIQAIKAATQRSRDL